MQKETNDNGRPQSRVNSLVKGGRNESATSRDGVTRGLSSSREYMNVGVSYQKRVNTIHGLYYRRHGLHTKKKTTFVIQAEGRRISMKKQK